MLLAIDPGADSGWALFDDSKTLLECGLGRSVITPSHTVIEKPRIYPGAKQKARAEDVITLAVRAGEWGGRLEHLSTIRYVEPHQWKGSVPKEIHQPRIWAKLNDKEKSILDKACQGMAPSKRHNVIDAVGIGLWAVGRAA